MNRPFLAVLAALLLVASACEPPRASAPVGIKLSALSNFCSGKGTAFNIKSVNDVRVIVTGRSSASQDIVALLDHHTSVDPSSGAMKVPDIPESGNACVTLLATMSDKSQWFARRRHVQIIPQRPTDLDMVLVPYGRFTCIDRDKSGTIKPTMFPATVSLTDGRILIAGGFTKAEYAKDGSSVTLSAPSTQAYIYDPYKGTVTRIDSPLTEGRAAFAMVDLNVESGEQVVLFGGAKKMTMRIDSGNSLSSFPLQWTSGDALNTYEVFDVNDMKFTAAGKDENGNPKMMTMGRVFPRAFVMQDNTVLVTGGGLPPKDAYSYIKAQVYSPYEDKGKGNFLGACRCLSMQAQRNGHAIATIVTSGAPQHLFVGGTTDTKNFAEIYVESAHQKEGVNGTFQHVSVDKSMPLRFFASLSPIGGRDFLLTGGLDYDPKHKAFLIKDRLYDAYYILSVNKQGTAIHVSSGSFKGLGRFFQQALPLPGDNLIAVVGGFNDFSGTAKAGILFYNVLTRKFSNQPAGDEKFIPKAGFAGTVLPDDTLMIVGGMHDYNTITSGKGLAEIYSSSAVPVELFK